MVACPACGLEVGEDQVRCACGFLLDGEMPHDCLPAGTTLAGGRYRIESLLGRGGFAVTYRGWDGHLDEAVAIKEFLPSDSRLCLRTAGNPQVVAGIGGDQFVQLRERFREEARLLRRLRHPQVVGCRDRFSENNTEYLVMDLVEGQTLEEWVLERKRRRRDLLSLFRRIAVAVAAVHEAGLVHRDLHPSNIMVCTNGEPVLIDFGLARPGGVKGSSMVAFTDGYAALEQYEPHSPREPSLDIYSLGAILYFMLTRETPPTAAQRHAGRRLLWPGRVPDALRQLVERAMAMRADERFQTAEEMIDSMDRGRRATGSRRRGGSPTQASGKSRTVSDISGADPLPVDETKAPSRRAGAARLKYALRRLALLLHRHVFGLLFLALILATGVGLYLGLSREPGMARALAAYSVLFALDMVLALVSHVLSRLPRVGRVGLTALLPRNRGLNELASEVFRATGSRGLAIAVLLLPIAFLLTATTLLLRHLTRDLPFSLLNPGLWILSPVVALVILAMENSMTRSGREDMLRVSLWMATVGLNFRLLEWWERVA